MAIESQCWCVCVRVCDPCTRHGNTNASFFSWLSWDFRIIWWNGNDLNFPFVHNFKFLYFLVHAAAIDTAACRIHFELHFNRCDQELSSSSSSSSASLALLLFLCGFVLVFIFALLFNWHMEKCRVHCSINIHTRHVGDRCLLLFCFSSDLIVILFIYWRYVIQVH